MNENIKINVENLSKTFDDKKVLDNISLKVIDRESLVIIGGSGTGKSILIKCIAGLITPDKGSIISINDQDYSTTPIIKRQKFLNEFGMLFQGGALFDSMKIWENISFTLIQNQSMNKNQARDIALQKLVNVGLDERVLDLYPSELSGGMQKRAALARAIVNDPKIIFFDEPTSGLDPITAQKITDLIADLSKNLGATTLTITHDLKCVKAANRVAMIHKGKIIWTGTGEEALNSDDEYVHQFINGQSKGPIE